MRQHHRLFSVIVCSLIIWNAAVPCGWAASDTEQELRALRQSVEALKQTLQTQQALIQRQQARLETLERQAAAKPPEPSPATPPPAPSPRPVPSSGLGQIGAVLPEIGAVGDIVANSSETSADTEGHDRISARELELVVGSYVDPYSRFDSTVAFSDFEAVSLEEAYLTRWGLPWDVKARFGRFFPRVGKETSTHRDSLPTVDEPFVLKNFFGGDGLHRTGADLTRPFQGPAGWGLEPSVGVLEGGAGDGSVTFGSNRRRPVVYSHLKTYKELSDLSGFELGLTHLVGAGPNDHGFQVNVLGVDATYIYHVTPINKLLLQSEVYVQDRGGASSTNADTGKVTHFDQHPWGLYLLGDYRFAPRWSAGLRLDQVRPVDTAATRSVDQGISAFLTFYQSEFARWRLQYEHETNEGRKQDNAVLLQGTFAIGTHKHSIQ